MTHSLSLLSQYVSQKTSGGKVMVHHNAHFQVVALPTAQDKDHQMGDTLVSHI